MRSGFVVVGIFGSCPPHCVLRVLVHNDELILRRTAGVDTCHYVNGTEFSLMTLFKTFEASLSFFFEELLVRGVVYNLGYTGNTVLG